MSLYHKLAQFTGSLLPRGQSKKHFLVTILCYELTLYTIEVGLVKFALLWPTVSRVIRPGLPSMPSNSVFYIADAVLVAPVLESMIIIVVIEIVRWLRFSVTVQLAISLLVICFLHSMQYLFWGLLVAPLFFMDIGTYLYWRRASFWAGAQMLVILHAAYNAVSALTLISHQ